MGQPEPFDNSPPAHRRALLVGAAISAIGGIVIGIWTGTPEAAVGATIVGGVATMGMGVFGWAGRERNQLSNHKDALTGLMNRTGLMAHLEEVAGSSRRQKTTTAMLFCDLDRFKVINDSMGHDVGDELLKAVAVRIKEAVRASDRVARFGGDEFVAVCEGLIDPDSAASIAAQILKSFERPIDLYDGDLVVAPSIGIATSSPQHRRTAKELLRDSDAAMYRAKRARTGYAIFDDEQRRHALQRLDLERALRIGIERGELEVFYQPIVTDSLHITSAEALVRWRRPGIGIVEPSGFLHVAEDSGLMAAIGETVMREACAQAALWNHIRDGSLRMGVNVAERQLVDVGFVGRVEEILSWAGLPAEQLIIEITEDLMIDHLDDSFRVLHELKELGVKLAIDDFGTGRSSLAYIKQLDMVDLLKIDKSFVDGIAKESVDLKIIQAIAALARAVGLELVAEGVETEEQAHLLRSLGIDAMQGHLFARPAPAAELEHMLGIGPVRLPSPTTPAPPEPTVGLVGGEAADAIGTLDSLPRRVPAPALPMPSRN